MANIVASKPVTVPSQDQIIYNSWFVTQLISKFTPTSAPTIVTLQRAAQNEDGSWVLMPNGPNSSVTFNVDLYAQQANFPAIGTALIATEAAVIAYASAKNLL